MTETQLDFATVTHGIGDTPSTDVKITSVPEVVALLGLAVLDAVRAGHGVCTMAGGIVDVQASIYDLRPRLVYLLTKAGVVDGEAAPGIIRREDVGRLLEVADQWQEGVMFPSDLEAFARLRAAMEER